MREDNCGCNKPIDLYGNHFSGPFTPALDAIEAEEIADAQRRYAAERVKVRKRKQSEKAWAAERRHGKEFEDSKERKRRENTA